MLNRDTVNRVLLKYAGKAKYLVPPQELFNRLKGETFIFFDTETTGLYANVVQVTEIAAMAVRGDTFQEIDKFHEKIKLSDKTLAKAKCEAERKSKGEQFFGVDDCLKLQGYNPNDPDLRVEEDALNGFYDFCAKHNAILVAQNAPFDLSMINSKIDKKVPNRGVFDTKLFMRFYIIPALLALKEKGDKEAETVLGVITRTNKGETKIHSTLKDVLKVFNVDIKNWHGAFADVMSTIEALKNIIQYFEKNPEVHKEEIYKQEQAKAFRNEREHIQKEKEKRQEYYRAERKREPHTKEV